MKDYYKILGVQKGANDDDIKKAYRRLAHEYHPDKSGGDEKKFKEINEAYQVLSNKDKRSYYDRFGEASPGMGGQGPFGAGGPFGGFGEGGFGFGFDPSNLGDFGDAGDIFDTIFEGLGMKRKRRTYQRGADIEAVQEVTLEEAFAGIKKQLRYRTATVCEKCAGAGHFPDAGFTECAACDGRGEVRETRNSFFGSFSQVRPCAKCNGLGKIPKKICAACGGAGRVTGERQVDVAIAPGVADGQIIKLVGMGEAGEHGAGTGDLYVRVRVVPHGSFARQGDDLFVKKEISLVDVLLGTPLELPSIAGKKVTATIPEHFSLKNKLKIPSEGMPHFGGFGHGDMYVELDIKTPKHLSSAAKKLLEELKREVR
ncbi:MAG: J domain-containing protein [Candidatus Harrisonbacteria bacterium]|nr:J domain-containing protein [Candidatus Harrisonbacteria bacterium]